MNEQELQAVIFGALRHVAPEADPASLDRDEDLREQLDIDSMDFFNFVLGLNKGTGVEIPERDYPKLTTLAGCAAYLAEHAVAGTTA